MKTLLAVAGIAMIALAGLTLSASKQQPATPSTSASQNGTPSIETAAGGNVTVIGHLVRRDRVVTILSGPEGIAYRVSGKDGKVLHETLSAEQLKAQEPGLYEFVTNGTAGDARLLDRPRMQGSK